MNKWMEISEQLYFDWYLKLKNEHKNPETEQKASIMGRKIMVNEAKRRRAKNWDKKRKTNQKKEGNWNFFSCQKGCSSVPLAGNFGNVAKIWNFNFSSQLKETFWFVDTSSLSSDLISTLFVQWSSFVNFWSFQIDERNERELLWSGSIVARSSDIRVWEPHRRICTGNNGGTKVRYFSLISFIHFPRGFEASQQTWCEIDYFSDATYNEIAFWEILFPTFQHPVYSLLNLSDTQNYFYTTIKEIWSNF